MLSVKEVREKLKDRRISVIAEKTGLSRQGIYNISYGVSKSPSYETMIKLNEYFKKNP